MLTSFDMLSKFLQISSEVAKNLEVIFSGKTTVYCSVGKLLDQ